MAHFSQTIVRLMRCKCFPATLFFMFLSWCLRVLYIGCFCLRTNLSYHLSLKVPLETISVLTNTNWLSCNVWLMFILTGSHQCKPADTWSDFKASVLRSWKRTRYEPSCVVKWDAKWSVTTSRIKYILLKHYSRSAALCIPSDINFSSTVDPTAL